MLTEVLMLDLVDELIKRRLKLKSFRQWARHIRALRDAQREPTHWGLEPDGPIGGLLRRIESGDRAVVVGPAGEAVACLLAAHEMGVTFMAGDLRSVTRLESRFESEALASAFEAYVVDFALWRPSLDDGSAIAVLMSARWASWTASCGRRWSGTSSVGPAPPASTSSSGRRPLVARHPAGPVRRLGARGSRPPAAPGRPEPGIVLARQLATAGAPSAKERASSS